MFRFMNGLSLLFVGFVLILISLGLRYFIHMAHDLSIIMLTASFMLFIFGLYQLYKSLTWEESGGELENPEA